MSWAFEHQQPAVIQSGCAVPLTTAHRRLAAIFLGSECLVPCSDEEVRFVSFVAGRVALAVDDVLSHALRSSKDSNANLYKENLALREEIDAASMFEEIVGCSDEICRVLANVKRVAPTDATVLITGQSGTGKELIARAIHRRSNRSRLAFIRVNCAAIPPSLIASELFGYEKGAFTGATQRHLGRFELANGGTIFLDEIGDIPAETQIALLRVLQERDFERVGGSGPIPIDVRVLAATNCDLRAAVRQHRSGWTCFTGSMSFRFKSHRCASARMIFSCWLSTSSSASRVRLARRSEASNAEPWSGCRITIGLGTFASCRMSWRGP